MKLRWSFVAVLLAASVAGAVPPFPVPKTPTPPTPPTPVSKFADVKTGQVYVVNSLVDGTLLVSPGDLVRVTKRKGPITVDAVFWDATENEVRDFAGPAVFLVKPVAGTSGRLEMSFVPFGYKSEAEIVRETVNINGGVGPRPPPVPPGPKPPDPPPVPVTSFRVFLVFESGAVLPPKQQAALYAKVVEDVLTLKCTDGKNGWRRRDKDTVSVSDDPPALAQFWNRVRPLAPAVPSVVFEINGGTPVVEPLPADTAALVDLVTTKSVRTGGK